MDKKTRFKLNFIKDHLKNARLGSKKPSKRHRKLLMLKEGGRPLILYKHFNPISIHRIIGDLVFLDTLGMVDDFVPLSSLWTPFKYISDIVIEDNFSICNKQDSEIFSPHSDLLIERLLSLGQKVCYNLAMSIIKFSKAFLEVPLARGETPCPVQVIDESKQLQTFLKHNSQYPIIMYHYVPHAKLGIVNSKIAINNVLRDMTFQDNIRVFEESLFVCPTSEYYTYMIGHLESCFSPQKDQYFALYVNTKHGVKKFMAIGENFTLNVEKVVVITFPRSAQTSDIQCLYDDPCESKAKPIVFSNKKSTKSVIRSFRDWEHLIRRYFDPAVGEEERRRCHYRVIDNGNRGQYPLELNYYIQINEIKDMRMEPVLKNLQIRPQNLFTAAPSKFLFEDPVRNGVLLHQILQELGLSSNRRFYDPARSFYECKENILNSLEALKGKGKKKSTVLLERIADEMLKGSTLFLEKLLNFIDNNKHPRVAGDSIMNFDAFFEDFAFNCLKTLINPNFQEEIFINWLKDLGIEDAKASRSWEQIANDIIKGDLLFRIYQAFMDIKIFPVHRNPTNETACIANLRKFLGLLRTNPKFPQKFLWMETEIIKGKKEILLGFLEDIKTGFESQGYRLKRQSENRKLDSNPNETQQKEIKFLDIRKLKPQQDDSERRKTEIFHEENEKNIQKRCIHDNRIHSILSERTRNQTETTVKGTKEKKEIAKTWSSDQELDALKWLQELGFEKIVRDLTEGKDLWLEFQDGILITRIIEKLEPQSRLKIDEKPQTKAACMRNMREICKFIQICKETSIEDTFIFDEEKIFEAKKGHIVALLLRLRGILEKRRKEHLLKKIEKCYHYFDKIKKNYVLRGEERNKMLVLPKYIDDDH